MEFRTLSQDVTCRNILLESTPMTHSQRGTYPGKSPSQTLLTLRRHQSEIQTTRIMTQGVSRTLILSHDLGLLHNS
jgi:hypothetical protein